MIWSVRRKESILISSQNIQGSPKETFTPLTCPHQIFHVPEIFTLERYRRRGLPYFQWIYFSITTDVTGLKNPNKQKHQISLRKQNSLWCSFPPVRKSYCHMSGQRRDVSFLHCIDLATLLVLTNVSAEVFRCSRHDSIGWHWFLYSPHVMKTNLQSQ